MCFLCNTNRTTLSLGVTECGHIFHELCWAQNQAAHLLKGDKLHCPQCGSSVHRLRLLQHGTIESETDHDAEATTSTMVMEHLWTASAPAAVAYLGSIGGLLTSTNDAQVAVILEYSAQRLIKMGAVVAIVRCLERHVKERRVAVAALGLVASMVQFHPTMRALLAVDRGFEIIGKALITTASRPLDRMVGEACFVQLLEAGQALPDCRDRVVAAGAQMALATTRVALDWVKVQPLADVLLLVMMDDDPSSITALARVPGVIPTLLEALGKYLKQTAFAQTICVLLSLLAHVYPHLRRSVVEHGGVTLLQAASNYYGRSGDTAMKQVVDETLCFVLEQAPPGKKQLVLI